MLIICLFWWVISGRINPTVNLWTPLTNFQVAIGDQLRTVQSTNSTSDLPIYLDFSEPIQGSSAELQKQLTYSYGVLLPASRRSRGNRRFAFTVGAFLSSGILDLRGYDRFFIYFYTQFLVVFPA